MSLDGAIAAGAAAAPDAIVALRLLLVATALLAGSGVPGLFLGERSAAGRRLALALVLAGAAIGIAGAALELRGGGATLALPSPLPGAGPLAGAVGVDALSAFFALPVCVVGGLAAVYGAAHASRRELRNGRRMRLCYGLLLGAMLGIVLARDGVTFLVAWEVMAIANFLLVTIAEEDAGVRRAGWLYLLYSHGTILGLFAFFLLAAGATGTLRFAAIPAGAPAGLRLVLFALALLAFGIKAGAMPLHSWLPPAHASAPSHVSAVMSGVVIKMGIYGLVRTSGLVAAPPPSWGAAVLVLGGVSALLGVVFALGQHDLKRLLAFHSIENVGIMLLGLGLALLGTATGQPAWVALGLAGCLLHVWNHALFKSLLFLGAGAVVHATGSRELAATGGLARRMPATAALFLAGSLAICGLPPLNGLVSELLVYLGLARAAASPQGAAVALAAVALAATGALAVACFVKVYGIVFLGVPRSAAAAAAHESPRGAWLPMAILAALCAAIGLAPAAVAPALDAAVAGWWGLAGRAGAAAPPPLATLLPFGALSAVAVAVVVLAAGLAALVVPASRRARARSPELPTWDCGYATASPRLQYTASSFAAITTERLAWVLRPEVRRPRVEGLFPSPSSFHEHVGDSLLDRLLLPATRRATRLAATLRAVPRGLLERYVLAVVAAVLVVLALALLAAPATAPAAAAAGLAGLP